MNLRTKGFALSVCAFLASLPLQASAAPHTSVRSKLPLAPLQKGGVCTEISWVKLLPGEKAFVDRGPDFLVFRYEATRSVWSVYDGNHADVDRLGPTLLQKDGVNIRRAFQDGQFDGYLAEKEGFQNHFFGSVFTGTDSDRAFFDRVHFHSRGEGVCAQRNSQG